MLCHKVFGIRIRTRSCNICLFSGTVCIWIIYVLGTQPTLFRDFTKDRRLSIKYRKESDVTPEKKPNDEMSISEKFKGIVFSTNQLDKINKIQQNVVYSDQGRPPKKNQSTENKSLVKKMGEKNESRQVDHLPGIPLFQSTEEMEFPTSNTSEPRIPHILHQMYSDVMIPKIYIDHVKSFTTHNPTWEYRFWTDESGRRLLQKHHPYLVDIYDKFGSNVKRSDMLRYAVLYEYGGFYADLDMDNLRSLNITTMKYSCIVPVEPFEHSSLLNNMEFLMNNAIMSCRPKHPFFKLLLSDLRNVNPNGYPVGTTGPGYVTTKFIQFNHMGHLFSKKNKTDWSSNSPYFYKGRSMEDGNDSVYVPNSQYFMDNLDPIHVTENGKFTKLCRNINKLTNLQKRGCLEFHNRKIIRENRKYTFTVHHWYHQWVKQRKTVNDLMKVNISDIVPNCILYTY